MRMPFNSNRNNNGFNRNSFGGGRGRNPFDGAAEMDIRTLTERALSCDSDVGYVTSDGQVMPRNTALGSGFKNGIELQKKRVWGTLSLWEGDCKPKTSSKAGRLLHIGRNEADSALQINVTFSREAQDAIYLESQKCPDTETGGALIGVWGRSMNDGSINICVERATGSGPFADKEHAMFSPNLEYYRTRVGWYRKNMGWDYLGEWHKHPGSFDTLSSTDIKTADMLIRDEGWPMLLLPIVNVIDGALVLENNAILSAQLGGGVHRKISGLTLEEPQTPASHDGGSFTVYVDRASLDNFTASGEKITVVDGVFNSGESCVFLPVPGQMNAVLKLVRAGEGASVSGLENVITGVLSEDGLNCWRSVEGDIVPAKHVIIDPSNSIYERNAGLTETDALKDMTVTLVGCGSLGSTLALSLARAGVGTFRLFDMDSLSPANIARHQANLRDLGRAKAAVLRDLIHGINPTINVDVNKTDIVNSIDGYESFCDAAVRSDLLVCTTDTDDSRMLVNDVAVEHGIKVIQAGLHERASSGIIHLWEPGSNEACFACHRGGILSESGKRAEGVAYSEAKDIRDMTVQPGLAAQINFVAEAAALRCIDALMDRHSLPSYTVIGVDRQQETSDAAPEGDNDESSFDTSAKSDRLLSLITRHLILERSDSCPVCSNRGGHEFGGCDSDGADSASCGAGAEDGSPCSGPDDDGADEFTDSCQSLSQI